jgi:uncharacterized protein (TIGR03067 family)
MRRLPLTALAVAIAPWVAAGCGGPPSPSPADTKPEQTATAPKEPAPGPRAEAELKRLEGTWVITSRVFNGTPQVEPRGGTRMVIHGATYALEAAGETFVKGALRVDPTKSPAALDLSPENGPDKGRTLLCIYATDGDTLRYCYPGSGGFRPSEFTAERGSNLELVTLRRVKAKG